MASSAKENLLEWVEKEKEKGLVDIKFFPGNLSDASIDSFCEGVLHFIEAEANKKYRVIASSL